MIELIQKLADAYGPSGFEDGMRELIRPEIEPYADEILVDAMGNLIALKKGGGTGPQRGKRVMIAAHMDEIGIMVTHITEEGFLRFTNIGGVNQQTLLGNRVQFQDGTIGVIYSDRNTDRSKVFPLSKHYIDVGANSREDCPISVGDAAGFVRPSYAQGQRVTGKAMDDRIGCVVAIETLKGLETTPHDVFFVFSVQEEVGVRGATVAANLIKPNIGIALDVTMTGDVHKGIDMAVGLGQGPAIKAKDGGMISHVGLVQHMKSTAQSIDLPYQIEVLIGGSTDARAMQIASAGCIAGCISIPCRYVHSQSETIDMVDVEGSVALLRTILENEIPI